MKILKFIDILYKKLLIKLQYLQLRDLLENENADHRKLLIGFIITSLVLQTVSGVFSIIQTAATTYFKDNLKESLLLKSLNCYCYHIIKFVNIFFKLCEMDSSRQARCKLYAILLTILSFFISIVNYMISAFLE